MISRRPRRETKSNAWMPSYLQTGLTSFFRHGHHARPRVTSHDRRFVYLDPAQLPLQLALERRRLFRRQDPEDDVDEDARERGRAD